MTVKGARRSRYLWPAAAVLGAAVVVTATAGQAGAASKASGAYKVAIVTSLTGAQETTGQPWAAGVQTAIDEINSQGGVNGHKFQVSVYDDQSSATISPQVAQRAVATKPTVIFDGTGIYYDARQSVYQSVPIPQFPAASIVGNFAWRYNVYLTVNQNPESTVATLKTVLHGLKKKRIGLVVVNSSGGLGLVPVVKNLVVKGGGVWLGEQAQDLGAASFTSGAANLIAAKPDGIGIQDIDADAIVEDKGLRSAGYKGPIAANALASSFSTLQTLKDPEYFGQALTKPVVKTSIVYKAAQKFGNLKYVDQSTFATAWVSVYTAAAALKKCGFPCPTSKFENAANGMGSFSVPGGLLWGNLSVSAKKHNLTNTYGLDAWNPKKKAIVAEPYLISAGKP